MFRFFCLDDVYIIKLDNVEGVSNCHSDWNNYELILYISLFWQRNIFAKMLLNSFCK